jgi:hypothetical protein
MKQIPATAADAGQINYTARKHRNSSSTHRGICAIFQIANSNKLPPLLLAILMALPT